MTALPLLIRVRHATAVAYVRRLDGRYAVRAPIPGAGRGSFGPLRVLPSVSGSRRDVSFLGAHRWNRGAAHLYLGSGSIRARRLSHGDSPGARIPGNGPG